MASVYFDSSALLKLLVDEPGSNLSRSLWNGADLVISSRLCDTEIRSVLAAARRTDKLSEADYAGCVSLWQELLPSLYLVEVTDRVSELAGQLIGRYALRSADAIHLASALLTKTSDSIAAVWEEHVAGAMLAENLQVLPALVLT